MRYRSKNSWDDVSRDVAAFVDLIGPAEYRRLLENLGKGLNHKGYVTETDDLRFSLELQLLNLELIRQKATGQIPGAPERIHEAIDFLVGLGQTIPHLSAPARAKLRGQIIGGLRKNGLRPLQHEMRVAGMICKLGWDVIFADLEGKGGCDFLAEKDGIILEVEAKSLPIFSGQAILPQDAEKFFLALRQKFDGWKDVARIPILNVVIKNRLSLADIPELVEACNTAAGTRQSITVGSDAAVQFLGAIPDASNPKVALAARLDMLRHGIYVYVSQGQPKVVVRLFSERPGQFVQNVTKTISDTSKRQFTRERPGIIWIHVDYINPQIFNSMAYANKGSSLFDLMALAVFDSPKKKHITQLVFSGGAHLVKKGDYANSSFGSVVYNSPSGKFGEAVLFPKGRRLTKPEQPLRGSVAKALLRKAILNVAVAPGQSRGPVAVYDDFVAVFGSPAEPALRELVAAALVDKGNALGLLGRREEAIAVYDEVLARFGSSTELPLRELLGKALFNKGHALCALGRRDEGRATYDDVAAMFGLATELPLRELVARSLVNKGCDLGSSQSAIVVYDDVLARFDSDSTELPLHEQIAKALFNKGNALGGLGDYTEAIATFNDLLARFGSSTETSLREPIAMALLRKGRALVALDRAEEAVLAYHDMLSRFGSATEPWMTEEVARVLVNKGNALNNLNRSMDAITLFDEVLALFGTSPEFSLRVQVAAALVSKGGALDALERRGDALAVYDDVLARWGAASEPALGWHVTIALLNKGATLVALGRGGDAVAVYDDVLARVGTATEPRTPELIATALFNKGLALEVLGRKTDSIRAYEQIMMQFGTAPDLPLRKHVSAALLSKGNALCELDRRADAVAVYDDVVARFANAPELPLREQAATAHFNKGVALGELGRSEEAITVYDEMLMRWGSAIELPLREQVARALVNKAATLSELGRSGNAIAVCDDLLARLASASEMPLGELVAMALVNKGDALRKLGQSKNAIAIFDDVLARFGTATEPPLSDLLVSAKSLRNAIQDC